MSLTSLADAPLLSKPLTSLADAPLLSKPAADAGLPLPRSKSRPVTKDQAAIDALFQEDVGMQGDKSHAERKHISPSRELPNFARKFDLRSNTGESDTQTLRVVSLPSILPINNQQSGDFSQKRQAKQDDGLFSKTKDANDVLAGFLADNSIDINVNKTALVKDEKKDQSEEFKSKWNSYPSQPFTRLPTLTFSPRLTSGSTLPLADLLEPTLSRDKKASDHSGSSNKDEKETTTEDVLSLLPDGCYSSSNEGAFSKSSSFDPTTSCQTVDEENSDFGGYQPSCLSISAADDAAQRRHLTSFFSSLGSLDLKEGKKEKRAKEDPPCILLDGLLDQTGLHQQGGPCNKEENNCHIDAFKRNPPPVQDSTEKIYIDQCSVSLSRESLAQEQPGFTAEIQRLMDENLALREEIMKIEADKLKIEKDILEKELLYEPQGAEQASLEKEEAQKIAEDLALELLTVKQSLSSTEEKIECMKKVHEQEVIQSIAIE